MNIIKKVLEYCLPYNIQKIEQEPIVTTNQNHEYDDYEPENFDFISEYLYHGIRFQKYLEKLENILKKENSYRKILTKPSFL